METEEVYAMPFAKIYPMLVEKAARKGRTQAEVDEIIGWLTGYSVPQIEAAVQNGTLYGDFFRDAPQLNPDRVLIKGSIGYIFENGMAYTFFSFHFRPSLRCVYVQCIPRFRTKKNVCRRIPDDNIIPVLKIRNLLIKRSMIRSQSRQKNKSNCIRV